jgi:hypothetical protein
MLKKKGIPTKTVAAVIKTCGGLTPHTVGVLLYQHAMNPNPPIPLVIGSIRGKTACKKECERYIEEAAEMLKQAERNIEGASILEEL